MVVFFLKLLCAHLLGDFVFQPYKWVACKEIRKHKSPYLYWHVLVHAVATVIILDFDSNFWLGITAIILSHFLIDLWKLHSRYNSKSVIPFFIDQLAHISVIVGVVYFYMPFHIALGYILSPTNLLFLLFFLFITNVASIIIKIFVSKLGIAKAKEMDALDKSGAIAGILERIFVFTFIILNFWIGIGFLIIAKSVFHFTDIYKTKDHKIAEYFFVGTLMSFGLAIIAGVGYTYCLKIILAS